MTPKKVSMIPAALAVMGISILGFTFFKFDLASYLTLTFLKENIEFVQGWTAHHFLLSHLLFFLIYLVMAALAIPGITVLSVAAGSLFGFWAGISLVSVSSTMGATIAFLLSRYYFKNIVIKIMGDRLTDFNKKIAANCHLYLFTLRIVPVSPFMMVNLMMGLTNISVFKFILVTQVGMLFSSGIYVNAGRELAQIQSMSSLFTPPIIAAFLLLGAIPFILKGISKI